MANTTFLPASASANVTLSGGNLIATATSAATGGVESQDAQYSGKLYFEFTFNTLTGGNTAAGFCTPSASYTPIATTGAAVPAMVVYKSGNVRLNGAIQFNIGALSNGSLIGIALDLTNKRAWFRLGAAGNWNASGTATPATPSTGTDISAYFSALNPAYPIAVFSGGSGDQITANFGDTAFTGATPTGYTAGWPTQTAPTVLAVTQAGAEVWASNPNAPLRVTQAGAEVWGSNTAPPLRVTQAGAEVWLDISTPYVPPVLTATQDPIICVIT